MIDRKTAIRHLDPTHRPDDRLEALQQTRNLKMTRSAHAYVRGSTVKFYAWLEASKGKLPEGPSVWICGDCHVGNLGPLGDAKGRVSVQIRDLDQTVVGNPAHDLVRLGLSLASAARGSELSGIVTAKIIEAVMVGYENGIGGDFSRTIDRNRRPDDVQSLLERSVKRRWRHLAVERLKDAEPTIPLGKSFWTLRKAEAAALRTLLASEAVHAMVAGLQGRDAGAAVEMVDAAYWKKGCSSLGRPRRLLEEGMQLPWPSALRRHRAGGGRRRFDLLFGGRESGDDRGRAASRVRRHAPGQRHARPRRRSGPFA